jgi:hypothetical protein
MALVVAYDLPRCGPKRIAESALKAGHCDGVADLYSGKEKTGKAAVLNENNGPD